MAPLPVIVGLGGINSAGRVSFDHAYARLVVDALPDARRDRTYASLTTLMGLDGDSTSHETRDYIDRHTLIRRIEHFDPDNVYAHKSATIRGTDGEGAAQPLRFVLRQRDLPAVLPEDWQLEAVGNGEVRVTTTASLKLLFPDARVSKVSCAGQLPTGFEPGRLYASRNHPRGLQLTGFAASDALRSTGFDVDSLKQHLAPEQMAVYSGSAMGQLDAEGFGGMMQNALLGKRPTSKNTALGLTEMPGDFVNAYVLGSAGGAAGIIGACATFLYNLRQGVREIQSGRKRLVLVGNSEAPVTPEIIEGYRTMGALAEDDALLALDGRTEGLDHRRACRPFSSNCGFTVAEASVFAVLMDDGLALELGARILGSVGDVFVNADGYKKSIPGPGIGNYLTVARAMALAREVLGEDGLRHGTHMQAHGTGTPQNRVTESHILNELARLHGIEGWPVSAVKAYVGHSMAPAGGDQLASMLGTWQHGWLPGITTIDHIAEDVHHSHLELPMAHLELAPEQQLGGFINSKGFGGNNGTAFVIAPGQTRRMLERRWGADALKAYDRRAEPVADAAASYDAAMDRGDVQPIYRFGEGVLEGSDLDISLDGIRVPGFGLPVDLKLTNPYDDMS